VKKRKIFSALLVCLTLFLQAFFFSIVATALESRTENYNRNFTLTGNNVKDIVTVAQAQHGKTKSQLGFTENYCDDFVADCARLAGISTSVIPNDKGGVGGFYNALRSCGASIVTSPKAGDILFYYCTQSKSWCHVGLMTGTKTSTHGNINGGKVEHVGDPSYYRDGTEIGTCYTITYLRPAYTTQSSYDQINVFNDTFSTTARGYYTITVDNPAFRTAPSSSASTVIHSLGKGSSIYVVGSGKNDAGNTWYLVGVKPGNSVSLNTENDTWGTYIYGERVSSSAPSTPSISTITDLSATNITSTDAKLSAWVNKPASAKATVCGIEMGTSRSALVRKNTETISNSVAVLEKIQIYYNLTEELGITLKPGTTYYYRFYCVIDGNTIYSSIQSFTTKSTHTHTPGAAATCTTAQTCTSCGATIKAALGHSKGAAATCTTAQTCTRCSYVYQDKLGHQKGAAATCTTAQTCTRCDYVYQDKLGHQKGAAATCTTAQTCTRCDYVYQDKLGHTPGAAATCTTAQTCTRCDYVYQDKLGHQKGAAATCTTAQTCTRCDYVYQDKLGHQKGAAATCTTAQTCTRCGHVYQNALGHTPGAAATCTTAQTCTRCDYVYQDKLGHQKGAAATCTTAQTCTRCDYVYQDKLGHQKGAAATCTTAQTCTRCDYVYQDKLGHTYTSGMLIDPTHPHTIYNLCSCGAKQDSGRSAKLEGCEQCYPPDPAKLFDLNGDEVVNILDALAMVKALQNGASYTADDVIALLRYLTENT